MKIEIESETVRVLVYKGLKLDRVQKDLVSSKRSWTSDYSGHWYPSLKEWKKQVGKHLASYQTSAMKRQKQNTLT